MQTPSALPLACFLSVISPPGVEFQNSYLQAVPIDKAKCPYMRNNHDVSIRLYTRHNPIVYEELFLGDDEKLASSHIDFSDPTVVYFHAFMESSDSGSGLMVKEAYMARGDHNVLMIDAQRLKAGPWYLTAAENTFYIGQFMAQFIDYLVTRGLDLSRTHLIGHSLGAQSAGVAGSALTTGRVARITGLDPALPLFDKMTDAERLDPTDAEFVDVIHTDAGIFGVQRPVGHVDFYPNGGISPQPGCELHNWPKQMLLEKGKSGTNCIPFKRQVLSESVKDDEYKKRTAMYPKKYMTRKENAVRKSTEVKTYDEKSLNVKADSVKSKTLSRQKRFLPFFNRQEPYNDQDNFLFRMLNFLTKNRRNVLPVVSVIKEINTLVKSVNGELNHVTKETNNYIGTPPAAAAPPTFSLELGSNPPGKALLKRILGFGQTDKLTVGSGGGGLFGK